MKKLEDITPNTQDTKNLLDVVPALVQLQDDKGKLYGRSYCKYGETSIFFNLSRKWDRIENIMMKAIKDGEGSLHSSDSTSATETFTDTVADMATYSLLWLGYIKENYPDEWEHFLKTNKLE